jgi:hypothetical protein
MSGGLSPRSPGDPRRRIGARVRVSHLLNQGGRREELEGVVVGGQKYGVNVRLPDGTIRGFSDVEVSPAESGLTVSDRKLDSADRWHNAKLAPVTPRRV